MVNGLMKRKETDEVTAMKIHYFFFYISQLSSFLCMQKKNSNTEDQDLSDKLSQDDIDDSFFNSK